MVAQAAVPSDRCEARRQLGPLAVVDGRPYGAQSAGTIALTDRIAPARTLDWSDVLRSIVVRPGDRAVVVRDEHGREFALCVSS